MAKDLILLLAFGGVLGVVFVWIVFFYYSKKRRSKIEEPKYTMLKDDD